MRKLFSNGFLKKASLLFLTTSLIFLGIPTPLPAEPYIRYQSPEFLTFEELLTLLETPSPGGELGKKLKKFWETPIISNEAYYNGTKPNRPRDERLGELIRIASWNIEKSFRIKDVLRLFSASWNTLLTTEAINSSDRHVKTIARQRGKLLDSDILILQEMDIGVKRSGYVDAAKALAEKLNMNYAYGAQQLEIDPAYLGTEKVRNPKGRIDREATKFFAVDPQKYKGVFGSAVLSRYPIKNVQVFQLKNQVYDWYGKEKEKTTFLEETRRFGLLAIFKNKLHREIKVGGRIFFRVDLEMPGVPGNTLTIINVHLEIKCLPEGREKQMKEILSYIKDIRNPVVLMGDFNAAPGDLSPTSLPREALRSAKNPTNWLKAAVTQLAPQAMIINATQTVTNFTKNLDDPLASDIPVIAPNKVKPLFDMIEGFRFSDGGAFDFRGDENRSMYGRDGALSNSNQKDGKGFKTTFSVQRPIYVIGKFRLDWAFVKSFLKDSRDENGPYRLAPHFGETLTELNQSFVNQISDHHPNIIDLPLSEPNNS